MDRALARARLRAILGNSSPQALIVQLVLAVAIAGAVWWVAHNTIVNLKARNLASGFDFLGYTAGFAISQSPIAYSEESTYGRALLVGLINTVNVSLISIVIATVIGYLIALARLSHNVLMSSLATLYIETLRNVPLLLQLFVWYFAVLQPLPKPARSIDFFGLAYLHNRGLQLPSVSFGAAGWPILLALLVGAGIVLLWLRYKSYISRYALLAPALLPFVVWMIFGAPFHAEIPVLNRFNFTGGTVVRPEFLALVVALSTYTAAFIAEIVRAGILSVPRGQIEAGQALGLKRGIIRRNIVMPQAMRVIIPPLTSQYLNLTKNSSLAVAIAFPDLVSVFVGTTLTQTGQAVEIIALTMAIYLGLSLIIAVVMNGLNAQFALKER